MTDYFLGRSKIGAGAGEKLAHFGQSAQIALDRHKSGIGMDDNQAGVIDDIGGAAMARLYIADSLPQKIQPGTRDQRAGKSAGSCL